MAARRRYRRALDLAVAAQAPYATAEALLGLGALAGNLGRHPEAEAYLAQAASIAKERGFGALSRRVAYRRQAGELLGR